MRVEYASETTYSKKSEIAGKFRKRYTDHTKDRSKLTCLIHHPWHALDECKVLGDFVTKYAKVGPTKDSRKEPATKICFWKIEREQFYHQTCIWWNHPVRERKNKFKRWNTGEHLWWGRSIWAVQAWKNESWWKIMA